MDWRPGGLFLVVLGLDLWASHMLDRCSISQPQPSKVTLISNSHLMFPGLVCPHIEEHWRLLSRNDEQVNKVTEREESLSAPGPWEELGVRVRALHLQQQKAAPPSAWLTLAWGLLPSQGKAVMICCFAAGKAAVLPPSSWERPCDLPASAPAAPGEQNKGWRSTAAAGQKPESQTDWKYSRQNLFPSGKKKRLYLFNSYPMHLKI